MAVRSAINQLLVMLLLPARWLIARLDFATRTALTGIVFAIPIAIFLITSQAESQRQIEIARNERAGIIQVLEIYEHAAVGGGVQQAEVDAIAWAADQSSLTLDTDLDSYYLMLALTVQLPQLRASLSLPSRSIQQTGESLRAFRQSLEKSSANNAQVRAALTEPLARLAWYAKELHFAGVSAAATARTQNGLAASVSGLHLQLASLLDALLQARISSIEKRMWLDRAIVAVSLLLVAYLAVAAYRSVIENVEEMVAGAKRIASGDFSTLIPVRSIDDMGKLATSLNALQFQLRHRACVEKERLDALQHLIAGVAHELGTPVGNIRMAATTLAQSVEAFAGDMRSGAVSRSAFGNYVNSVVTVGALLERNANRAADLLDALKQSGSSGLEEGKVKVDLAALAYDVLKPLRTSIGLRNCRIAVDIERNLAILAYRNALEEILFQLFRNALTHGVNHSAESEITVSARMSGERLTIVFADNGPGVPTPIISKIFDPFFTTAHSNGNLGMGLYIVKNLTTHVLGGGVSCLEADVGFALQLELPVA